MAKRLPLTDADGEVRELTEEDFKRAVPFSALPEDLQAVLRGIQRGRPKAAVTKQRISIRLSPEVLDGFRERGAGWQTRIDAALKEWLQTHRA